MKHPHSHKLGGFSENDGTIDFYLRIRSVLSSQSVVVDLGAGRAGWYEDDQIKTRKELRYLRPDVASLIAVDLDPAVLENKSSTENIVLSDNSIPLPDQSVDVVIADYVLEHVNDPAAFETEIKRILKPGGYFCARTPHKYNYVALGARAISNKFHAKFLKYIQPGRKSEDVFPTCYRMNTLRDVRSSFRTWQDYSFVFRTDPSYYFGSKLALSALTVVHKVMPSVIVGNLFIFCQKR